MDTCHRSSYPVLDITNVLQGFLRGCTHYPLVMFKFPWRNPLMLHDLRSLLSLDIHKHWTTTQFLSVEYGFNQHDGSFQESIQGNGHDYTSVLHPESSPSIWEDLQQIQKKKYVQNATTISHSAGELPAQVRRTTRNEWGSYTDKARSRNLNFLTDHVWITRLSKDSPRTHLTLVLLYHL